MWFVKSCPIPLLLIVHIVTAQDGQPCYTSSGVRGVCMSITSCPTAFQLNINPFSLFGAAPRGCQNFLGIGSVCCSRAVSSAGQTSAPAPPRITTATPSVRTTTVKTFERPIVSTFPTTARPSVGLECVRPDGSTGPCAAETTTKPVTTTTTPKPLPITTTTGRSTKIRSTTPIVLQKRLANDPPIFAKPTVLPTPADGSVVRLGEHDMDNQTESAHVDVPVYKYVSHPSYDTFDGHSDVAILFLTETVEYNARIKPICLPTIEPVRSADFTGYNPFIAGWGRTKETGFEAKVLQELQIPIRENEECSQLYKKIRKLYSSKQFDDAVLCAGFLEGGKDSCQGDSGGPLMLPYLVNKKFHYFQIGIVSYGVGCARAELPGVYTRVVTFVDWIVGQIKR
uniref:Peptidase S1 domain-containing protein n=1 Tax=Anopheles quadriannulatus TaxID=34691 RepID=A0A182XHR1_ANOQN